MSGVAEALLDPNITVSSSIYDTSTDLISNANKSILNIMSWEGGVLFAGFVLITLVWELGTAFLAFVTIYFSGRKAIWLQRLKVSGCFHAS
jgi:hypothetical protein